jgi:OOP family OmpA-OmpF porin
MRRLCWFALALALPSLSAAQGSPALGWALDRHDPAPAGDGTLAVEHPRYTRGWDVAGRLLVGHAFTPLQLRRLYADTHVERRDVIAGMTVATLDASVSLLGRASFDFSLPVSLHQSGEAALLGVLVVAPADGPVVGDARVGGRVRLLGRAGLDPFSLHVGAWLWFPTGSRKGNTSDGSVRFEPRLIAAGTAGVVRWSFVAGLRLRREVEGLNLAVGHELHLRAGATVGLLQGALRVGPELTLVTPLVSLPDGTASAAFASGQWGMEALLGAHVALGRGLTASAGGGVGVERGGGTPAGRVLVSLTWRGGFAPTRAATE